MMSELKKTFNRWLKGEKVYEAGRKLPEVVITPDEEYNAYLNTLPDNQRLTPNEKYDQKRYWELGGKPKDFDEAVKRGIYTLEKDGVYHAGSIAWTPEGDAEFMKPNVHPTKWMEDEFYDNNKQFQKQYRRTLDWTRPGFSKYERNINPLDHINLPKYDGGTDVKKYLEQLGFFYGYDKGKSIHINPANKGKFNATKKRTGKTTEQLAHSKKPLTRKRAIFALNARKWHH